MNTIVNTTITRPVRVILMTNCRDMLAEHTEHVAEWIDHLSHRIAGDTPFSTTGLAQLSDYLHGLHQELSEWNAMLTQEIASAEQRV